MGRRGFTLVELVVVLAIIGVLVGIIAPTMLSYTSQARITRAEGDVKVLGEAIINFYRDTALFPIYQNGQNTQPESSIYKILVTQGDAPSAAAGASGWLSMPMDTFSNQLIANVPGYPTSGEFAWDGPYLGQTSTDPWGNYYLLNAEKLTPGNKEAAWVLSAGPNGTVETPYSQPAGTASPGGDDIVYRIK